jgi:hypothetical protein
VLPAIVVSVIVTLAKRARKPPPMTARFPLTVLLATVTVPNARMPPPNACAASLSLMVLRVIVVVPAA